MLDSLVKLGLSEIEAKVYTAIIKNGPCFVAVLVNAAKKHRQIVYNALESLEKKNLITVSQKNGKHYYTVGEPDRILIDLKQKETLARQVALHIAKEIKKDEEKVEVFSGEDAYINGLADFRQRAEEAREYIILGGEPTEWHQFTREISGFHLSELRRLKHLGIPICVLFFEESRSGAGRYFDKYIGDPYTTKISSQKPHLPQTIWIAGSHIYLRTPVSEPLVIHIQSPALSMSYRKYFEALWQEAEIVNKIEVV